MEPLDPYAPPQAENVKPLGSLAQSARGKEIRQAQTTLIVIGLLTMAFNGFLLYNIPNEIAQALGQGPVDPGQAEEFRRKATVAGYAIYGGVALLGLVFVVLGLMIKTFPVPITITSLILYIGSQVGLAFLNPVTLAQGWIVKAIIVLALFRAVKAARAYEAEARDAGVLAT